MKAVKHIAVAMLTLFFGTAANAIQLVTEEEAALPNEPILEWRGSPTRRPEIIVVSPAPNAGLVRSPFILRLRFKPYGGAAIDRDSILITYKKIPAIDLTQRVLSFIKSDGVDIVDASIPPGTHYFRAELKDSAGRVGRTEFAIRVEK
jgi:hypothetical protein